MNGWVKKAIVVTGCIVLLAPAFGKDTSKLQRMTGRLMSKRKRMLLRWPWASLKVSRQ